jgi:hypothetical protein
MKFKALFFAGMGVFCLGFLGCGGDDPQPPAELTKWEGSTPHFWLEGTITQTNGGTPTPISIKIEGADATDTTKLRCRREYMADPDSNGDLDYTTATPSELKVYFDYTDADKTVKHGIVEFKKHDFRANQPGDTVTAINRDGTTVANASQFFFVYQANSADGTSLIKTTAQSGTYTHGEFQCTPDATNPALCGPLGDHAPMGNVGGYASGVWSASENLKVSLTAPCTTDIVEARAPFN